MAEKMERDMARCRVAAELAIIGAAIRRATENLNKMKEQGSEEEKTKKELEKCKEEKAEKDERIEELERKVEELEVKVRLMEELGGGVEERRVREAERKLEDEMKGMKPLTEEGWEEEKEERKAIAGRLVITGLDMNDTKERVEEMLGKELGKRYRVTRLSERKGKDGLRRWFYEMEGEEEKKRLVTERGEMIKDTWKMKISGDRTYRERKTKQLMDKRAEVERARNKSVRIRVCENLICVDGTWEAWDEKESKWMDEKKRRRVEAEKEKERLEKELRKIKEDLNERESEEEDGEEATGGGATWAGKQGE